MHRRQPGKKEFVRICGIDNAFEAQLLGSILEERGIAHHIRSHHDTAYNGLFQMQKGWGEIAAPEGCREQILEILDQIRNDPRAGVHEVPL